MEDFLFGLVANGTGVIENQVGFLHGFHLPIALMHQRANDFFRVMDVHLAAKGLKVKRFVPGLAHSSSISQQKCLLLRLFLTIGYGNRRKNFVESEVPREVAQLAGAGPAPAERLCRVSLRFSSRLSAGRCGRRGTSCTLAGTARLAGKAA